MQLLFHSLEVFTLFKTLLFYKLKLPLRKLAAEFHFLEGHLQLSRLLKLQAESTSKRPKGRYQRHLAIPCADCHGTLRQQVVTVRYRLPAARSKLRQLLPHGNMQIRIHLVKRFTISVYARNCRPANPLVAYCEVSARTRQF